MHQTARSYLMATACAGTFAFGTLVAFLGATLPELRARLDFGIEQSGALISLFFLPQIPMSFLVGPLIDRFGKKPVLASGSLLCAIVFVAMSVARTYAILEMLVFTLGLGASCINSGSNTLVADLYPENSSSALNLASAFFSLGTVGFPVLVTLMARRLGVAPALVLVGVANAIPGVVSLAQTFPLLVQKVASIGLQSERRWLTGRFSCSLRWFSFIHPWRPRPRVGFVPTLSRSS